MTDCDQNDQLSTWHPASHDLFSGRPLGVPYRASKVLSCAYFAGAFEGSPTGVLKVGWLLKAARRNFPSVGTLKRSRSNKAFTFSSISQRLALFTALTSHSAHADNTTLWSGQKLFKANSSEFSSRFSSFEISMKIRNGLNLMIYQINPFFQTLQKFKQKRQRS